MPEAQPTPTMQGLVRHVADRWWLLALRGLLLVGLGLYMLFQPKLSLVAYVWVLGIFVIADGALAIMAGIAGWVAERGWAVARGALLLLVGAAIVWQPQLIGKVVGVSLVLLIALASIIGGVMEIIAGVRARRQQYGGGAGAGAGGGWAIASGALSVLFGIVLIGAPLVSLALLISLSGVVAALIGVVLIVSALRLRRVRGMFVG
jgi:uncharacterized membrane protein HdeD (DUF308 family)